MDALSLMGMKRTVFLPVSCNERAHETDVCNPICNQSGFSCSDLAPMRIRQLQSACARSADVGDPNPGCLQVATAIQQIVSRAVVSTEIVDIMAAAGLDRPDISVLSDEFLAEVRDLDKKNLAIEALRKLLNGQVRSQGKRNVIQAKVGPRRHSKTGQAHPPQIRLSTQLSGCGRAECVAAG